MTEGFRKRYGDEPLRIGIAIDHDRPVPFIHALLEQGCKPILLYPSSTRLNAGLSENREGYIHRIISNEPELAGKISIANVEDYTSHVPSDWRGDSHKDFDGVICRIGLYADGAFNATPSVRSALWSEFLDTGIPTLNSKEAMIRGYDKCATAHRFAEHDVPRPKTCVIEGNDVERRKHEIREFFAIYNDDAYFGAEGIIVKHQYGGDGLRVYKESLLGDIETYIGGSRDGYILQEFIPSSPKQPSSLRVHVVGDQCINAVRLVAPEGNFRSNHGEVEAVELTKQAEQVAIAANRALGLEFGFVDLIETRQGKPLAIESNPQGVMGYLPEEMGEQGAIMQNEVANAIVSRMIEKLKGRNTGHQQGM